MSAEGGRFPRWSPDGSRLFFWNNGRLMAAPVQDSGGTLQVGAVEEVLKVPWGSNWSSYGFNADGDEFLVLATEGGLGHTPISLFLNWQDELARR